MLKARMNWVRSAVVILVSTGTVVGSVSAGGFLTGSKISYPTGYSGNGATLDIKVCIAPGTADADQMSRPLRNAIAQWNRLRPGSSNVRSFFLPHNKIDFESVALHELGHCIGLAHPNLGGQVNPPGATGIFPEAAATVSSKGINGNFDLDAGPDNVYGSADDVRGDDENLFFFRRQVNNPFSIAATVDASTYTRDVAALPAGELFPTNSEVSVSALGQYKTPFTEAVMQHDIALQQLSRHTSHDDVSIVRYGMSGVDEIQGTADDYSINLEYGGVSDDPSCDINFVTNNATALASCNASLTSPSDADYWVVTNGTISINNNDIDWFYNQTPPCSESVVLVQNEWKMFSLPCDVGISTSDTVADILGDDLGDSSYQDTWFLFKHVYEENPAGDLVAKYIKPALSDKLKTGEAYWLLSTLDDQAVDVEGEYTAQVDVPVFKNTGESRGWNLVGSPFRLDTPWAITKVVDTDGAIMSLAESDPGPDVVGQSACTQTGGATTDCTFAKYGFKWLDTENGYELISPDSGRLSQFGGAWVSTGKSAVAVRFGMTSAERNSP